MLLRLSTTRVSDSNAAPYSVVHPRALTRGASIASTLYWLATAALLFTIVDALAGFALLASAEASLETFGVTKRLFDALTGSASFGYGASALLIAWTGPTATPLGPRKLMLALRMCGAAVALSGTAVLLGFDAGLAVGLGLAVLTLLFTWLAVWNLLAGSTGATRLRRSMARP